MKVRAIIYNAKKFSDDVSLRGTLPTIILKSTEVVVPTSFGAGRS